MSGVYLSINIFSCMPFFLVTELACSSIRSALLVNALLGGDWPPPRLSDVTAAAYRPSKSTKSTVSALSFRLALRHTKTKFEGNDV